MVDEEEEYDDTWLMESIKNFFKEYKDDIGSILRAWAKNIEKGPGYKFWTMVSGLLIVVFLISVVAYLSTLGIVSGDAVAFLIGAIAGYLFSFLRQHIFGVG